MLVAFDVFSWYGVLVVLAGGYLLWAGVVDTGHRHYKVIRRRLRPEPPTSPIIVLGHPSYSYSTETINERTLAKRAYLTNLSPRYLIENKEAAVTVTDLTAGVRRKDDGREHIFDNFKAAALAPLQTAPVTNVSVPRDLFDGLTDQDYEAAFFFWVHLTEPGGVRWEVAYDPQTGDHHRTQLPATS